MIPYYILYRNLFYSHYLVTTTERFIFRAFLLIHMKLERRLLGFIAPIATAIAVACGGDGGGTGPSKSFDVSLTPNPSSVQVPGNTTLTGRGLGVNGASMDSLVLSGPATHYKLGPGTDLSVNQSVAVQQVGDNSYQLCAYGDVATKCASTTVTGTQAPPPVITITSKTVTPQNPIPGTQFTLGAGASVQNYPSIDSISVAYNGSQPQAQAGGNYSKTFTAASSSQWAIINAYANTTVKKDSVLVTPATMYGLHVLLQNLGTSTVSRATLDVDGTAVSVPVDTTLQLAAGSHSIGLKSGQTQSYDFGEMTFGSNWFPIHPAGLTYSVAMNTPATATFGLISRSEPNFSGTAKQEHDMIWPDPSGYLHPTKIVNWDVYLLENPPAALSSICQTMSQTDIDGAKVAIPVMASEDSAGPDGRRRVFTYRSGDPIAAGKLSQVGGFWRPASGVVLMCTAPPTTQSNDSWYDNQGFFDAYWARAGGDSLGWISELRGFDDFVYNGNEGTFQLSRNDVHPLIGTRTSLDTLAWNVPLRIAYRAGQKGFGLIKSP